MLCYLHDFTSFKKEARFSSFSGNIFINKEKESSDLAQVGWHFVDFDEMMPWIALYLLNEDSGKF